ncbi:MAG: ATP-binding protein, partial [Gemmatimonadota bacterium]|nr:ATP-binding protein [Gemmatimonadota bacterium]
MQQQAGKCDLEGAVERTLRKYSMLSFGGGSGKVEKVLAAVSAGLDSMVMLEVLHRLSQRLGFELCVAHFDHGLRGTIAARTERRLVEQCCQALDVRCYCARADVGAIAAGKKLNLQDAARQERY